MKERINAIIEKLKKLSLGQKIALVMAGALLISGLIVSLLWFNEPQYQLLYGNLSPEDAGSIINRLKELRVSYKLKNGGKDIYVPQNKVYETRLQLASEGLPKGGQVGFEIFDRSNLGVTDFVQKLNYQRALQGELARTISSLEEVKWARVHIVMPQESLFSTEEKKPSASVLLELNPNQTLTRSQVRAIANLVAASVSGMTPDDVVIVDNAGHMLAGKKGEDDSGELIGEEFKYRQKVESTLERKIEDLLERAVGPGKVIAKVSVDMDFSRVEKKEELYNPDLTAVRSEQKMEETTSGAESVPIGIPGVASNVPQIKEQIPNPPSGGKAPQSQHKLNQIINYEISKTVQHVQEPIGQIKRISVAVLVDGIYKNNKYYPRPEEELAKFKAIVEKAVGFSKTRGDQIEVVSVPFDKSFLKTQTAMEATMASAEKKRMWAQIALTVFKGIILLAMIIILARFLKNLVAPPEKIPVSGEFPKPVREFEEAAGILPKPKSISEEVEKLRQEIKEIAQKEPARIAQLAKAWIKEES